MAIRPILIRSALLTVLLVVVAGGWIPEARAGGSVTLTGAGSSFDAPLFKVAFAAYATQHPEIDVRYSSVGSGAGISQFAARYLDFGATDLPMTDAELAAAGGADAVVHIPVTLGTVAVFYNLPSLTAPLNLDGQTLAAIYLGVITEWNDPRIAALNPGVALPSMDIIVCHRSDGSGTTGIFSSYLSSVSPDWAAEVGSGSVLRWPIGTSAPGSAGLLGQVEQFEGGIGYAEPSYLAHLDLGAANILNSAGAYVSPTPAGATACAMAATNAGVPDDLRMMIAGCTGADPAIYPISGFSWIVVYAKQSDPSKAAALEGLLQWLIHDGQQLGGDIGYAPLPDIIVAKADIALGRMTSNP